VQQSNRVTLNPAIADFDQASPEIFSVDIVTRPTLIRKLGNSKASNAWRYSADGCSRRRSFARCTDAMRSFGVHSLRRGPPPHGVHLYHDQVVRDAPLSWQTCPYSLLSETARRTLPPDYGHHCRTLQKLASLLKIGLMVISKHAWILLSRP
jgi:hypothetical protein